MRELLSVTIITKDEEKRIAKCLESVSFADEILVVDSGSTDRTVEIAKQHGARVIEQTWLGYGRQKQFAVEQAKNDWVLCLDADEWLSDSAAQLIQGLLSLDNLPEGYLLKRSTRFMKKWLRHGDAFPDWSLRLFDRNFGSWSADDVHEKVTLTGMPPARLDAIIFHDPAETLSFYIRKQEHYTDIQASKISRNKRFLRIRAILGFLVRFIRVYFFKQGYIDGLPGLLHAYVGAKSSYMKYIKSLRLRE